MLKFIKHAIGALIGNSMQFYDFTIYAFLAPQISKQFFLIDNIYLSYLIAISIFASGYLTRPIGALIFGYIGDKKGRSIALSATISLSIFSTLLIGILPTPELVGIASPILLIFLRLVQGLAVSGEEGGAVVLLFEKYSFKNKGIIGALILSSVLVGVITGSFICSLTTYLMNIGAIGDWGWRLPFLFSLPIGIIAIRLRFKINDFRLFRYAQDRNITYQMPTVILFKKHLKKIIFGVSVVSLYSITTSTLIINLPYVLEKTGIQHEITLAILSICLSLICFLSPYFGTLINKYNQLVLYKYISLAIIVVFPIAFKLISIATFYSILLSLLMICILIAFLSSIIFPAVVEIFPFGVRYSGVSLAFNLSITIFSSTTPIVLIILENSFNELYMSGIYISALCGMMLFSALYINRKEGLVLNKDTPIIG